MIETDWRACVLTVGAVLLGAVCEARPAVHWDMISLEVKSWGRPVSSWRLLADGSGSWTETVASDGSPRNEYTLVWHEFRAGPEGYGQVEAIVSQIPDPAPDYDDCKNLITDLPYGTLRLTRGATTIEIAWNSGCMDEDYRAFTNTLKAADAVVAGWGSAGRILRIEPAEPAQGSLIG